VVDVVVGRAAPRRRALLSTVQTIGAGLVLRYSFTNCTRWVPSRSRQPAAFWRFPPYSRWPCSVGGSHDRATGQQSLAGRNPPGRRELLPRLEDQQIVTGVEGVRRTGHRLYRDTAGTPGCHWQGVAGEDL
jgi:hypothetical protein